MNKWFLLYSTRNFPEANIIKGMLEENDVPVMVINKQDSSYIVLGEIELYVPIHLKEVARRLVDNDLLN